MTAYEVVLPGHGVLGAGALHEVNALVSLVLCRRADADRIYVRRAASGDGPEVRVYADGSIDSTPAQRARVRRAIADGCGTEDTIAERAGYPIDLVTACVLVLRRDGDVTSIALTHQGREVLGT